MSVGSEFHRSDAATGKDQWLWAGMAAQAADVTIRNEVGGEWVGRRRELAGSECNQLRPTKFYPHCAKPWSAWTHRVQRRMKRKTIGLASFYSIYPPPLGVYQCENSQVTGNLPKWIMAISTIWFESQRGGVVSLPYTLSLQMKQKSHRKINKVICTSAYKTLL